MHDPLYARALVLEGNGERMALVNADLVVMTRHFAMGRYEERIFAFLRDRITQAVREADKKKRAASRGDLWIPNWG